jgi:hypothetical protein
MKRPPARADQDLIEHFVAARFKEGILLELAQER